MESFFRAQVQSDGWSLGYLRGALSPLVAFLGCLTDAERGAAAEEWVCIASTDQALQQLRQTCNKLSVAASMQPPPSAGSSSSTSTASSQCCLLWVQHRRQHGVGGIFDPEFSVSMRLLAVVCKLVHSLCDGLDSPQAMTSQSDVMTQMTAAGYSMEPVWHGVEAVLVSQNYRVTASSSSSSNGDECEPPESVQQLTAAAESLGVALCNLPAACCCNNPGCGNVSGGGPTERSLVARIDRSEAFSAAVVTIKLMCRGF